MSFTRFWTKYILRNPKANTKEEPLSLDDKARNLVIRTSMGADVYPFIEKLKAYDTGLYVHSLNVATLSVKIALLMNMNMWTIKQIAKGGLLHDYGKMFISTDILNAPRKLTRKELKLIKMHPSYGYDFISGFGFSEIVEDIILHHHEEERGKGYPDGSTDIWLETKIVGFADKYDALVTYRPYNQTFTKEKAITELLKFKGNFTEGEYIISLIALSECPNLFEYSPKTGLKRKTASVIPKERLKRLKRAN